MGKEACALKIALLLESDGPGGAETVLLTLAQELRNRGHDVLPVGPKYGEGWLGERFRELGFAPETFHLRRTVDLRCMVRMGALMRRHDIEVMHSHEFTMGTYGAATARFIRLPHVITMHGGRYFATRRHRRLALRWAIRNSYRTIAVSTSTARDLEQSLGFAQGTVKLIPNGHRLGNGNGLQIREELGLTPKDLLVANVGNLYPVKGQDVLVSAASRVLRERPELPLHIAIAGRGEQESTLRSMAQEAGIADRVHLLGFRDDIPDLLAASDIFALPSRSEGLPLALLEAMSAGTPIIASAVGGIPEVVRDGETALLFPAGSAQDLASALLRLATDRELRSRLAENGRDLAQRRYSPEAMAAAYEAVYHSSMKGEDRQP